MNDTATILAVNKAIDRQMDALIRAAAANVARLENSRMEESQIRNLVNVADHTESQEVVTNFIRYQIGRRTGEWGSTGFGKAVIADIETGAVPAALEAVTKAVSKADPDAARARIIALYLGYLNRAFVYAKKSGDWKTLSGEGGAR